VHGRKKGMGVWAKTEKKGEGGRNGQTAKKRKRNQIGKEQGNGQSVKKKKRSNLRE